MNQSKKQYYNLVFKQDAAQLVISKGYSPQEAASSLGVSVSSIRKWVAAEKGVNKAQTISSGTLTLSEHEELLRLRKENIKLKMEREILKKAAAFFAQEQG